MTGSVHQWKLCVYAAAFPLSAGLFDKAGRRSLPCQSPLLAQYNLGSRNTRVCLNQKHNNIREEEERHGTHLIAALLHLVFRAWMRLRSGGGVCECMCAETLRPRAARSNGCWWCSAFSRAALLPGKLWSDGAVTPRCDWLPRCGDWGGRGYMRQESGDRRLPYIKYYDATLCFKTLPLC